MQQQITNYISLGVTDGNIKKAIYLPNTDMEEVENFIVDNFIGAVVQEVED